jgi:hypothetical protein
MAKKGRKPRSGKGAKKPRARIVPAHVDFGPAIDLPSLLHRVPPHETHHPHAQRQQPAVPNIAASHGAEHSLPAPKQHPIRVPEPMPKPRLPPSDGDAPLTYEELDRKIAAGASQAGHVAFSWQLPLLAFILFGAIGAGAGFAFGSKIDAFFLAACFGIAGALAARMASRESYAAWSGFIPGLLFGGGIMLLLDLIFRQNLSAFWFVAGLAIGAALDFAFRKKSRAG